MRSKLAMVLRRFGRQQNLFAAEEAFQEGVSGSSGTTKPSRFVKNRLPELENGLHRGHPQISSKMAVTASYHGRRPLVWGGGSSTPAIAQDNENRLAQEWAERTRIVPPASTKNRRLGRWSSDGPTRHRLLQACRQFALSGIKRRRSEFGWASTWRYAQSEWPCSGVPKTMRRGSSRRPSIFENYLAPRPRPPSRNARTPHPDAYAFAGVKVPW